MRSREEQREERRRYEGDVEYEVWRSGGNPDMVDRDRVDNCHDMGYFADEAARVELRHQRPQPQAQEQEQEQEQWPEE